MATNFPCSEPVPLCDQSPNPSTQYNSDAVDKQIFVGLSWNGEPPRLGKHFDNFPCFGICESTVNQTDADFCAARLTAACPNPCDPLFYNSAQTAIGQCQDDLLFYYTVAPGLFTASNQLLADRMAYTYAVKELDKHRLCLSNMSVSCCFGNSISEEIHATGNYGPFRFIIISGGIPPGIVMENNGTSSVIFSGTSTSTGIYPFMLEVTDSAGSYMRKSYVMQIAGITTGSPLSDGTVGTSYSVQLYSGGYSGTVTWTITSGSLPDGLTLDSNTGIILGTPTTDQDSTFTVSATDGSMTCMKEFTIHIETSGPPPIVCIAEVNVIDASFGA